SVEAVAPVYCNAPPLSTRFAAALVEAPMLLFTPPLASVFALSVPLLMVDVPVYELAPLRPSEPVPFFVKLRLLLMAPAKFVLALPLTVRLENVPAVVCPRI